MSFNEFVLRAAFGDVPLPDGYEFVLAREGDVVGGYTVPVVPRGRWVLRGSGVFARVQFGPVASPLVFDEVQVRAGGQIVDRFDVGEMRVPPGVVFGFTAEFDLPEAV